MNSRNSPARQGSGQLSGHWAAKAIEVPRITPFHRRRWVRRLLFVGACTAGLGCVAAGGFLNRWQKDNLAELAKQRHCLDTFLRSPEFAQFASAMDQQLLATVNFITARPHEVHALLPAVAAHERVHRQVAWPFEVMPRPVSAAARPQAVLDAHRDVGRLLARRGFVFDDAQRATARPLLLRAIVPYANAFLQRAPDIGFQALPLDRKMQDAVWSALGAHHGATSGAAESERLFSLYALIGPAMWRAIELDRSAPRKPGFSGLVR